MRRLVLLGLAASLAACGGPGPLRYAVTPGAAVPQAQRVSTGVRSLEIREASLPLYAELEPISIEIASGVIASDDDVLWADDPRRAVTQGLASALARTTATQVAAEPWPFEEFPDARLDVRLDEIVARADGTFVMTGQYFIADTTGAGRDRARVFAIEVPFDPADLASVARAKGQAIADLAARVAVDL